MSKGFVYCNSFNDTDYDPSEDGSQFILVGPNAKTMLGRLLSPSSMFPFKTMSGNYNEYEYSSFNAHRVGELKRDWSKETRELFGPAATSQYNVSRYLLVQDHDQYLSVFTQAWDDFLNTALPAKLLANSLTARCFPDDYNRQSEVLQEIADCQQRRGEGLTLAIVLHALKIPVLHGVVENGVIIPDEAEYHMQKGYEEALLRIGFNAQPKKAPPVKSNRRRI